jgi:uncharacterized secreted protein with C-terminal beta-propeller domain
MSKYIITAVSIMFIAILAVWSTSPGGAMRAADTISFDPQTEIRTQWFKSVDEYSDFIRTIEARNRNMYKAGFEDTRVFKELSSISEAPAALEMESLKKGDFSETNVQVAGIDEADIMKTDGDFIYAISNNRVFIVRAYPGKDAEIVSIINFNGKQPTGMFINGNKLTVFGHLHSRDFLKDMDFAPVHGMSFFEIYDISDRSRPELKKNFKFEGTYFNARMKDEHVYFVLINQTVSRATLPTPVIIEDEHVRDIPVTDIAYFNIPYMNPRLVTVHSIDIEEAENNDSKSVAVEYGQNMYMSHKNIYITYTKTVNEQKINQKMLNELIEQHVSDTEMLLIDKIRKTDDDVLSEYEKDVKITKIYMSHFNMLGSRERARIQNRARELTHKKLEKYGNLEFTVVHRIGINNGRVRVKDNGTVPGHIINQFSMDEKEGVFRIATTISRSWSGYSGSRESTNNVYTLDDDLYIIGRLEGLARSEQIYSTRFIGDRLYMVTFRQIDPFFVIDLKNPRKIKELGKLKIPGFSRYLHPYDRNTIIGIGQDATEQGRTTGLKISLFDVSNVSKPKEVAKFVTDEKYANSTALYEHKAFLFDRNKKLLVIPAFSHSHNGDQSYNGAFVFRISKDKIKLRGLIDHSMAKYGNNLQVERSLWIKDLLYTKSPNLLRINEIASLSAVKNIALEDQTVKIMKY